MRPKDFEIYTKFKISFWKQEPPKPTEACRNLGPILESIPIAFATSDTLAPVASQRADKELIDDIRWARKAFAVSLDSSDDHKLVVKMFSLATQELYTSTKRQ